MFTACANIYVGESSSIDENLAFEYTINEDDTLTITKYNGTKNEVVVPTIIDGKTITSIGDCAFYNCSSLTNVIIPDDVTSIGSYAFYNCSGLNAVYFKVTIEELIYITIYCGNDYLANATSYYYSESEPTDTTYNYWHYVDGKPTAW